MAACDYKWMAPRLAQDSRGRSIPAGSVEQRCYLPKNHDGDHRSPGKVTSPNLEKRR